jgi:hypothetical protein
MRESIEECGYSFVTEVLDKVEFEELVRQLGVLSGAGRRGMLQFEPIAKLSFSERILSLVRPHMPAEPRPVRAIYFDKNPEKNWLVPSHQDLTIAVRSKREVAGFGPWSLKEGVHHVQPPIHLLEQMLTVRLHLDDCDELNGALQVIPGSHKSGRLSPTAIQRFRSQQAATVCIAAAGDALLMRPLLLHYSGRSRSARHRRVVHIEYASFGLPDGLEWHDVA